MKQIKTNDMRRTYPKLMSKLEDYVYYCLRCLHRIGIHPSSEDFTLLTVKRKNGNIAECIVYPKESINDDTVEIDNPMFLYGFKVDWDFRNLTTPISITFCDTYKELIE